MEIDVEDRAVEPAPPTRVVARTGAEGVVAATTVEPVDRRGRRPACRRTANPDQVLYRGDRVVAFACCRSCRHADRHGPSARLNRQPRLREHSRP